MKEMRCSTCGKIKSIDKFYGRPDTVLGLHKRCKICMKIYQLSFDNNLRSNLVGRMYKNLQVRMSMAVSDQNTNFSNSYTKLIGCTKKQLFKHLEENLESGMSFDNYGKGKGKWCIDHIKECKSFDLTKQQQQEECFNYTNIRPMWFFENLFRGRKCNSQK